MHKLANAIHAAKGDKSLEQFAADMGCSYATAQRWAAGSTRPTSRAHIQRLANAGVPMALLVEGVAAPDRTVDS